jgi:uncharacterized membrane protein YhaH (DUF805 family)
MDNPYSAPLATTFDEHGAQLMPKHYGGIRRLPYLGIIIGLAILRAIVVVGGGTDDPSDAGTLIVFLLMVVAFMPVYYRLKNIGMNPWWCLLMVVPIANLIVAFRCLAFQEGYVDTKKLDTAGTVTTFIVVGLFVLLVIAVIWRRQITAIMGL